MNFLNKLKWKLSPPKTRQEYEEMAEETDMPEQETLNFPARYEALSGKQVDYGNLDRDIAGKDIDPEQMKKYAELSGLSEDEIKMKIDALQKIQSLKK